MEDHIKEIVAIFLKIPTAQIGPETPVNRSALQSSILLHRMYARLNEQGYSVENYSTIKTFDDLVRQVRKSDQSLPDNEDRPSIRPTFVGNGSASSSVSGGIGIDIQEIQALPRTDDFRKDTFYRMNFTPAEMAHCILQQDPYASFAGLFAAKEAIIKADGQFKARVFNTIEIGHTAEGAPLVPDFNLSISHSAGVAIAVAVNTALLNPGPAPLQLTGPPRAGRVGKGNYLTWIALLLAVLSFIILLWRQRQFA